MDFNLTEDQQAFAQTARQFAESELAPHAAKWDQEHIFPKDTIKAAGELGFCGLYTPEEAGGLGLSRLDSSIIFEQPTAPHPKDLEASLGVLHCSILDEFSENFQTASDPSPLFRKTMLRFFFGMYFNLQRNFSDWSGLLPPFF